MSILADAAGVLERHPEARGASSAWGHLIFCDPNNVWRWDDTGEPIGRPNCPRRCPKCKEMPSFCDVCDDFHDACLGHLDGMKSVCCGHGCVDDAILMEATK